MDKDDPKKTDQAKDTEAVKSNPRFTFDQIVSGKRFKSDIDIVYAVLDHSKEYTIDEVEALIKDFRNRKVG